MVLRSVLLGFEGRDQVSTTLFFQFELFLTHRSYIIHNLPEGGIGSYGWDDGQGDD